MPLCDVADAEKFVCASLESETYKRQLVKGDHVVPSALYEFEP